MSTNRWLLKAEPDSRIVKGKDVKFSVDDFERVKTSPWEGVRNYEARNLMKEMRAGEKAVFYHSNCKRPGIAAFAQVSKEAYPDYTAWDESHPYYDSKSDKHNPRWYMVDLTFTARAKHFIPLTLLRYIADTPTDDPPEDIDYIGRDGIQAIKNMDLVSRGRLSVQRISASAWEAIQLLAENGGWEEMNLKPRKTGQQRKAQGASTGATASSKEVKKVAAKKKQPSIDDADESPLSSLDDDEGSDNAAANSKVVTPAISSRKRKVPVTTDNDQSGAQTLRRSNRRKITS